ncbi:MAG: Smr/MutS family protein, partial [Bacteroidales bacterium]
IDKLKRREKDKANRTKESIAQEKKAEAPLVVGDTVRIKGQTTVGEILEIQAKQCVVAFGLIKTSVKIDRIERVGKRQAKKEQQKVIISSQTSNDIRDRQLHFQQELDVRGMRADEALQAVAYYIDDALLCAGNSVRILHGTGTGALRQVIRQYLATVPGIKHFRDEHVQFGGAGITVIEFN